MALQGSDLTPKDVSNIVNENYLEGILPEMRTGPLRWGPAGVRGQKEEKVRMPHRLQVPALPFLLLT